MIGHKEVEIDFTKKTGRPADPKNRENIVNAAIDLFVKNGYENTTTLAIARQAGVSSSYIYFKDKETLLETVVRRVYNEHYDIVIKLLESHKNHSIEQLVDLCMDALATIRPRALFVIRCVATPGLDERFTKFSSEIGLKNQDMFSAFLKDIEPEEKNMVTHALMAVTNNYFLHGDLDAAKNTIKRILKMCLI